MKCGGVSQLRREYEEAQLGALSALEEQHSLTMAEQQQAHDDEKRRLGDKLTVSRHAVQPSGPVDLTPSLRHTFTHSCLSSCAVMQTAGDGGVQRVVGRGAA